MIEQTANHLWQSSLVAALAGLLTLTFRRHRAEVRYWLWLAASLKFLIPFDALTALGRQLGWRLPGALVQPQMTLVVDAVAQPFSQPVSVAVSASAAAASPGAAAALTIALAAIWLGGCLGILLTWCVRWRRVGAAVRRATPVSDGSALAALRRLEHRGGITTPIALVSSDSPLEPGVFGILRPVLLWPRHIAERLGDEQVEAILAHELSHVRRRDNLTAALHMIVQALFWFHPLVWWVGARLVDERERACDEEVIRLGSKPQVYAESILRTCEFYVESRLACVAGVTGSDLKQRIEAIMRDDAGRALGAWGKILLGVAAAVVIATPVGVGALHAPHLRLQAPAAASDNPTFEVASIKPNTSGDGLVMIPAPVGGRWTATNVSLRMLIRNAYQVQNFQLVGGPGWVNSARFDIVAKGDPSLQDPFFEQHQGPARLQMMIRALLADRFKLAVHSENRELSIYGLLRARRDGTPGPHLAKAAVDCIALAARGGVNGPPPGGPGLGERPGCGMRIAPWQILAGGVTMSQLANTLSPFVNRIVLDRTGLTGPFDIDLRWTPEPLPPGRGDPPPGAPPMPTIDPNGPSIFTAMQEQLGLKLESTSSQVDVLVIDYVEPPTED